MSVRVGVIGAGVMGGDHARIIAEDAPGATLHVICDADAPRARKVGEALGAADVSADAMKTATRPDVDAVLIASPDETHADLAIAAIEAGKPVLCEKPLAPDSAASQKVVAAEMRVGRRLIQTGFMRRFDPSYVVMREAARDGRLGPALMMHNFHRNVAAPDWFTGQMAISNSAPHEFDIARFVLGAEFRAVTAFQGGGGKIPPVVLVLETDRGQLVQVEVNVNAAYGYDVRAELVCQDGSVDLAAPDVAVRNAGLASSRQFPKDWRPRFAEAYRLQAKDWIKSVQAGAPSRQAASAWDGHLATVIAEAGVAALKSGARRAIEVAKTPPLYAQGEAEKAREGEAD